MLLKLAWRNIWRNRRRSLITLASIVFAVMLSTFMESLQKGAWNHMIDNVVSSYYGYVQIHSKGYWDDQVIDRAFMFDDSLGRVAADLPSAVSLVPRLESFALGASANRTRAVMLVGTDPAAEDALTGLSGKVIEGKYPRNAGEGMLIGDGLARQLDLGVGDTIVLISQGFRGVNAAGKYAISGIVSLGSPELDKMMAWMSLPEAQWFFGAEGRVTSLAVDPGGGHAKQVTKLLRTTLDTSQYEIMSWEELLPELLEARALDSAGNYIVYFILYLIIAFGMYGTILMMAREREYEFGVLLAVGMRRLALGWSVYLEVLMLGLFGALAGMVLSVPLVWYFRIHPLRFTGDIAASLEKFGFEPIFPTSVEPRAFLMQAAVVLILTTALALYPIVKIAGIRPMVAMRI
jgi:ABC-type lipoprotein release transport system permease subunit